MKLAHDLLDKQLVNRNGYKLGRVDGIVAELKPGAAPRLVAIEMGSATLARRLGRRIAAWALRMQRRWSPARVKGYRIPIGKLEGLGIDVMIDVDARSTPGYAWEAWVRDHIIKRIPGA